MVAFLRSLLLSCVVPIVFAEQVLYRSKDWVISAPDKIDCSKPIPLLAKGSGSLFDQRNDALLEQIKVAVAPPLARQCPGSAELVISSGRARKLISFSPAPAAGPQPTSPQPTSTESSPAPAPQISAPAQNSTAPPISARNEVSVGRPVARPIEADRPAPPSPTAERRLDLDLAGTWIGIYQVYPEYIQMTLTIASYSADGSESAAELRLDGLKGKNASHMGVSPAVIKFNSGTRTLDIRSAPSAVARRYVPILTFHAVYDAERGVFAGSLSNHSDDVSPYFVLVRQGQNNGILKRLQDLPSENPAIRSPISLGGSSPSKERLGAWASQIYSEHPTIDPSKTSFGKLYAVGRNLFRDEYFTAFFGKPYDQLSRSDLDKIHSRLESLPLPRANFPEDRPNNAARAFARGFLPGTATYASSDVTLSVLALRSISNWRRETIRRLPTIAPEDGAFQLLNLIEAETQGTLSNFFPSELESFGQAVDDCRARLAGPLLTSRVEKQISTASSFDHIPLLQQTLASLLQTAAPSSPRGSRATTRRPSDSVDIAAISGMAPQSIRAQLRPLVEQRIMALVTAEAEQEASRLAPLSGGAPLAALEHDAKAYAQLRAKYASFTTNSAVGLLFSRWALRRAQSIQTAQPELNAAVQRAKVESDLDELLSRYLGQPTDRTDAIGLRLISTIESRKGQIRVNRQKALAARRQFMHTRQQIRERRMALVAAARQRLSEEMGVYLPTFDELSGILRLVPAIQKQSYETDIARFTVAASRLGFKPARNELSADINIFRNSMGHELVTFRLSRDNDSTFAVRLAFKDAPQSLIELYADELGAGYRHFRTSAIDITDSPVRAQDELHDYIREGGGSSVCSYKVEKGELILTLIANNGAKVPIKAERLDDSTLRVGSYSFSSDVTLKRGQRIRLNATGTVTLGPFAGSSGPAGIDGFGLYRRDDRFSLGALLGRIGDGDWFLVGADASVVAQQDGPLSLRINDLDPANNEGYFEVEYWIE